MGRYHLEDYGSHDIIVQDDVLYQAYYDGGVRVLDAVPWKGKVFWTDFNSGLWGAKLEPKNKVVP